MVEQALGPAMMLRVVNTIVGHRAATADTRATLGPIADAFRLAALAPTRDLPEHDRRRFDRRLVAVRAIALDELAGQTIATAYAAAVRWLETMTRAELVTVETGTFADAFDLLWVEIVATDGNPELLDRVDRKSAKRAAAMHDRLRRAGYFPGPNPFAD